VPSPREDPLKDLQNIPEVRSSSDANSKAERIIEALRGTANVGLTTDEIMEWTRGEEVL
jgi:hypothetical protein